ncbi:hypothetical protein [Spirosoma areae]
MKTNQARIAIWLLVAGLALPMTGIAKHNITTTAHAPGNWQDELSAYLDYVELSARMSKSTTVISFRLDEQHRIQDVIVLAKDKVLIDSIKSHLQGQRLLNPCPMVTDESGNERCVVRLHFAMQF